jgi:asparagine synthase (glutamine-hydrolysing)
VQKLPPATVRVVEADGTSRHTVYWRPEFTRDPDRAGWSSRDWEEALLAALRTAVERRMVSDVPVGVLLSGGIDSSLVVALLAEQGQTGLATFSIGFESAGGESGDEFEYSTLVAQRFGTDHHRIRIGNERLLPGIDAAVAAMSEPMVSHDCVAFYLLAQDVSRHVKVVQSGQGADEVLGGYDWYPPLAGVPRSEAVEAYSRVFFDRRWAAMAEVLEPSGRCRRTRPTALVRDLFGSPPARRPRWTPRCATTPRDAGRRPGEAGRQHDDGVGPGGARPVPRPRARRARRAHPAGAEAGRRREGRAQARSSRAGARRGHRPDQGVLPGARDPAAGRAVP